MRDVVEGYGLGLSKNVHFARSYSITSHIRPIPLCIGLGKSAKGSGDILLAGMQSLASKSKKSAMFAIEKQQLDG
jgi:hypothetical protein